MTDPTPRRGLTLHDASDLDRLPIDPATRERDREAARAYAVRAPRRYLELVDWDDPADPVRAQVIPRAEELQWDEREREDPIGDRAWSPVERLTHRHADRVLLYPTYRCAVYCRHCFRKESLAPDGDDFSEAALAPALDYIASHPEIREVILTGGDPWVLSDARLAWLRGRIESVAHVRLLRIHTRVPVALPERVDAGLVAALRGRLMVCVVTHFNHPREITPACVEAARTLREAGFMLLNQTVLLRGVNDDVETLEALSRELVYALGVKPYYLHHCDLTRGLSHLRTTLDEGLALMKRLRARASGVCVPTYVLDLPGGGGKVPLGPAGPLTRDGSRWVFESHDGSQCPYEEVVAARGQEP
ncbi:MAG: KamA family radical SAM protein [Polyangiales bacterium]